MLRVRQAVQQGVLSDPAQQIVPLRRQAVQVHEVRQALPERRRVRGALRKARRRQAVQVRPVSEAVQPQDGPAQAHVLALWREAVLVLHVRQGVHSQGPHAEALRDSPQEDVGQVRRIVLGLVRGAAAAPASPPPARAAAMAVDGAAVDGAATAADAAAAGDAAAGCCERHPHTYHRQYYIYLQSNRSMQYAYRLYQLLVIVLLFLSGFRVVRVIIVGARKLSVIPLCCSHPYQGDSGTKGYCLIFFTCQIIACFDRCS